MNGTLWCSRDGVRQVRVVSEAPSWMGDRMFLVETVGTGRRRLVAMRTLLRKYIGGAA